MEILLILDSRSDKDELKSGIDELKSGIDGGLDIGIYIYKFMYTVSV